LLELATDVKGALATRCLHIYLKEHLHCTAVIRGWLLNHYSIITSRMKDNNTIETMQVVAISNTITLYRPNSVLIPTHSNNDDGPDLIILCAWFRALPKYTAKYLATHHDRYPHAQIILLQSTIGDMQHTPYSTQRKRYLPVVELIQTLPPCGGSAHPNKKKILLHIFSNGGSNSAVQLASAWHQTHSSPFPCSAIVLDSAPGSSSLALAGKAIISSFPPRARWWVAIFVYLFVLPVVALPALVPGGGGLLIDVLRARLNDAVLFPRGAPRVYLASPADEMVPMEAVVAHCEAAREAGFEAEVVAFEGSGHVAHVREDGGRYWGAVWDVWERGCVMNL
jgi:hypothetical protein